MENTQLPSDYPVKVEVTYPEQSSRLLALLSILFIVPKAILVIPHFVILYVFSIVSFVAWILSQFAVLFTGRYPKGMFDFIVGVTRWQTRASAYFMGLTDKYPPFSLS